MDKFKKISLSLGCIALLFISSVVFYGCNKLAVSPIEPINYVEPTVLPQFEGKVIDAETGAGISNATLNLGGVSQTTDLLGNFSFAAQLSPGAADLTVQAAGYLSTSKSVEIPALGASVFRTYQMIATSPPVTISQAEGGTVEETSDEGTIETVIPAGALAEDTPISITSTLGSASPVDVSTIVTAADEAPAQSVLLEPQDVQFSQPVQMQAPLSFPAEFLTGGAEVVRINPVTRQPEVVGTAVVENGKFKYDITQGGQYIVRAKTSLRHVVQTVREAVRIGSIGFNERPGTFRNFSFNEQSTIETDPGFSKKFIEGVYGFSDASRMINFAVAKDPGSNNAVSAYVLVEKTVHIYTTPSGRVIAKITEGNSGTESSYEGNFQAKWLTSDVHGTAGSTFLGWWWPNENRYLTISEINNLGLPNPPPQP